MDARDIADETLRAGINPQELLLDLARGMDEDRRDSTAALEASFAEPRARGAGGRGAGRMREPLEDARHGADLGAGGARASRRRAGATRARRRASRGRAGRGDPAILLVDDEDDVRRVLAEHFTQAGYQVVEADDPDAAVKKAGKLGKAGIPFLLVTDLGMPTSGGSSFQGGFEVVKRLWKMNLHPPVLMMTETLWAGPAGARQADGHRQLRLQARALQARPRAVRGGPARLRGQDGAPTSCPAPTRRRSPRRRRAAARRPAAAAAPRRHPPRSCRAQFAVLQRRLGELRRRGDADGHLAPGDEGGARVLRARHAVPGQGRRGARPGRLRARPPRREPQPAGARDRDPALGAVRVPATWRCRASPSWAPRRRASGRST